MTDEEKKIVTEAAKIVTVKLTVGEILMIRHALMHTKPWAEENFESLGPKFDMLITRLSLIIDNFDLPGKLDPELREGIERTFRHMVRLKTCGGDCDNCEFQDDMEAAKAKSFMSMN